MAWRVGKEILTTKTTLMHATPLATKPLPFLSLVLPFSFHVARPGPMMTLL